MNKSFERVAAFIECHSMFEGASGIVVAVSGGADSVALLDMLVRFSGARNWRPGIAEKQAGDAHADNQMLIPSPRPPVAGLHLHVAHLDHQLRGTNSVEDAKFVERLAQSLTLPVTIESFDVRAQAEESGRGIEETARDIRYKFLLATAQAAGFNRIATGHTMSDQAETFLMRLARGAGLRGLAAMRPVSVRGQVSDIGDQGSEETHCNEVEQGGLLSSIPQSLLIRPLLCITREEVEEYCRARGLEFLTDPTNESMEYTRNRVRHEVLPALRRINPGAVENIARAAEIIAEAEDAFDHVAGAMLEKAQVGSAKGTSLSKVSVEVDAYSVPELRRMPAGLRRRVVFEAIMRARRRKENLGGEARSQITSAHVALIEKLLEEKASGNRAELPDGLEVWREFEALVFKSTRPLLLPEYSADGCEISQERGRVEAGGLTITIERNVGAELLEEIIERARQEKAATGRDWMVVALDDALLPGRLTARPRRPGETALVTGRRRTIKLKNLMIGHKIPASRRNVWPVVATPDGRYVWSPGLPPAVEFAASDRSRTLAILRASGF
jgi:tRNA(Ile)-lysidine synthase